MLINLKAKTYKTKKELVQGIGVGNRTLERWIHTNKKKGIKVLLSPIVRPRSSASFTQEAQEALHISI